MQSIFSGSSQSGKHDAALIQAATERVVDGTDPRLRTVSRYQRKLQEAVEQAVEHVVTLIDTLPPAIEASRQCFTADPQLRALFVSAEHLQETVSFSQGIQEYLKQSPVSSTESIYAALGMERSEKTVFGMELQGEVIRRDVTQVAVSFSGHRVACATDSETDTRWELKKRAFDHLIEAALQQLSAIRAQRQTLEQQRILLKTKAAALKAGNLGLGALTKPAGQEITAVAVLEQRIGEIDAELVQIRAGSATLANHLARVAATLREPQQYLRLERLSLTLDQMNIKVPEGATRSANTVVLDEAWLGAERKLVVLLIRFPRSELLIPPDAWAQAERYLF